MLVVEAEAQGVSRATSPKPRREACALAAKTLSTGPFPEHPGKGPREPSGQSIGPA